MQASLLRIEKLAMETKSAFDNIKRILVEMPKETPILNGTGGLLIAPQNLPVERRDFLEKVDSLATKVMADGQAATIPYDPGSFLDRSVFDRANEYLAKLRQIREYATELKQFKPSSKT